MCRRYVTLSCALSSAVLLEKWEMLSLGITPT